MSAASGIGLADGPAEVLALRASELSYRRLFEAAQDGVLILDFATGEIRDVNPYLTRLLGFTRGEMVGRTVAELSPFRDIESNHAMLARLQEHGYVRYDDLPLETRTGLRVDVEFVSNVYAAGTERVIQCNIRDITGRKRAEESLRLLSTCVANLQDMVIITAADPIDAPGPKIVFLNAAFERITGYASAEALGGNPRFLQGPKTDRRVLAEIHQALASRVPIRRQILNYRKDGSEYWLDMDVVPVFSAAGACTHFAAVGRDITREKKLDEQFMRAQRMESIGTLAGGIAHDLNNILAPILMSIELLKATVDQPKARAMLETIEVSARRGADIVRQVLSFARGVDGERIDVPAPALFADLEKIIRGTFPKDIRLEFSQPAGAWAILGDPTQLQQVLLNLSVNARDAMPLGGSLRIGIANCPGDEPFVRQQLEGRPGRFVNLSVADSGSGIPPHLLGHIFEPFFTTKEVSRGTGLGLSTVMAIVKSHDGIIKVYSEPGHGTTFNLYLPAGGAPTGAVTATPMESLPRGRGETLLVADDEAAILAVTSETLNAFGYRVLTAADGAAAAALYAQHAGEIALVLTDMTMPLMDGAALVQALFKLNPGVRIVAASGLNADAGRARLTEGLVRCFLTKPFTAESLLRTIRSTLDAP